MNNVLPAPWPELPIAAWRETYDTLHLWTQIAGKIRFARSPWLNHSWHVALYVTARGLTTSPIPDGTRTFQIDFDFIDHALRISDSDGAQRPAIVAHRPAKIEALMPRRIIVGDEDADRSGGLQLRQRLEQAREAARPAKGRNGDGHARRLRHGHASSGGPAQRCRPS